MVRLEILPVTECSADADEDEPALEVIVVEPVRPGCGWLRGGHVFDERTPECFAALLEG
jgi:hypothetical protein